MGARAFNDPAVDCCERDVQAAMIRRLHPGRGSHHVRVTTGPVRDAVWAEYTPYSAACAGARWIVYADGSTRRV